MGRDAELRLGFYPIILKNNRTDFLSCVFGVRGVYVYDQLLFVDSINFVPVGMSSFMASIKAVVLG